MFLFVLSCKNGNKSAHSDEAVKNGIKDSIQMEDAMDELATGEFTPVFGYRFVIEGDFDGDGKKEKLVEHYYSGLDHKETNKFYENLPDYEELVTLTMQKKPYTFITSDNSLIDTLYITFDEQQLGLSYLKNEGDLNGDGTDEISYVVNWADWSNCNTWHIMTYRNSTWEKLCSFPMWDWLLPDLPETFSQYGLMGLQDKVMMTDNELNDQMDSLLNSFEGLVKKVGTHTIRIIYSNDEAEPDSAIIDLNNSNGPFK